VLAAETERKAAFLRNAVIQDIEPAAVAPRDVRPASKKSAAASSALFSLRRELSQTAS